MWVFVFVFSCDRKDERVSGVEVARSSSYLCVYVPHVGAERGHIRVINKNPPSLFSVNRSSSSSSFPFRNAQVQG